MSWNDASSHRPPPTFRLVKLRSQAAHQRRGATDRGEYRQAARAAEEGIVEVSYARSMWIARLGLLMRARWGLVLRILLAKAANPTNSLQALLKCCEPTIRAAAARVAATVGRAPGIVLRLGVRSDPNANANCQ